MIAQTIYVQSQCHLRTKLHQLELCKDDTVSTIPIEDIGILILDHPQISYTTTLVEKLLEHNVQLVYCDTKHMPHGMLTPLRGNQRQQQIHNVQLGASKPVKKKLWQHIVRAKIHNQMLALCARQKDFDALRGLTRTVQSGDTTNCEALAARLYWSRFFDIVPNFKRSPQGVYPNSLLNYGYAILRAAVARALVSSGLLVTHGIHHHNKYNAFCLADDIMEPYRPFVDIIVYDTVQEYFGQDLDIPHIKKAMLSVLTSNAVGNKEIHPLQIALSLTTASLVRYFEKTEDTVFFSTIDYVQKD